MPTIVLNLHKINALFKRIVHSLGVGPSLAPLALKKKKKSNHNSLYLSTCLHILEFPGIISFPGNYPETIRISWNSGNFLKRGNTGTSPKYNSGWGLLEVCIIANLFKSSPMGSALLPSIVSLR